MKVLNVYAIVAVGVLSVFAIGCQSQISYLKARNELNKGVQAFTAADYPSAVTRFSNALELDPTLTDAKAYRSYAYMNQFYPGSTDPENLKMAQQAIDGFQEVLEVDPTNMLAVSSMASLYFNMKEFDKAEEWHRKRIELAMAQEPVDPGAADSYYTIGVIKWTDSYQPRMAARTEMGMDPNEPGPLKDAEKRKELAVEAVPAIESGLEALNSALDVNPDYADAMVYLNLLERERADFADSMEEYDEHIAKANDWVAKAMETKRRVAEEGTTEQFQQAE
jgi:tetratricopeptide (TPR) repeat protein